MNALSGLKVLKKIFCDIVIYVKWLQECDANNESRKFYKQVNRMRDGFQARPLSCRSIDGDILSDRADILNRWKEYFQDLYGGTEDNLEMPPQWTAPSTDEAEELPLPT
jgi:hypothetical protein